MVQSTKDKDKDKQPAKKGGQKIGFVSALIERYGSTTVSVATLIIAIVFCMWFTTRQMNWMQSQFESAQEKNYTEIVSTIQSTVDESVRCALDERDSDHNDRAMKRIQLSPRINADLKRGLVEVGCDDLLVCEFHNGYTNIATNLPFCRYSVTYEAVRTGVAQVAQEFQSIPISPLLTMTEPGKVSYFKTSDVKDIDGYIYYFMDRERVRDLYGCPIMHNGKPCGVLVAINTKEHDTDQEKLKKLAGDIALYLNPD
jgi:hypothetical protein